MAERMSVRLLVDFVSSSSVLLNLIGAEGLYSLASGPIGQHDNISFAGGVPALIYLVRRTSSDGTSMIAGRPVCYCTLPGLLMRPQQSETETETSLIKWTLQE